MSENAVNAANSSSEPQTHHMTKYEASITCHPLPPPGPYLHSHGRQRWGGRRRNRECKQVPLHLGQGRGSSRGGVGRAARWTPVLSIPGTGPCPSTGEIQALRRVRVRVCMPGPYVAVATSYCGCWLLEQGCPGHAHERRGGGG